MKSVRDRLKELNHKLYESLIRSHEIAWNEWLPALSVQQDSYNSYPHIRNLEMYLDAIVNSYEESRKREFFISAVEMYIILAVILFHDIGRINKKDGKADNHPSESSRIICGKSTLMKIKGDNEPDPNYKVWASLGIPSYELALSIGRICEYHDIDKVKEPDNIKVLRNSLASIYIDEFGEVRQKALAALLTLLDHLDSAHTRIMPEYLRGVGDIKVVGAFRRVITGVFVDLKTHMVRTVLNEALPCGKDAEVIYKLNHGIEDVETLKHLRTLLELRPIFNKSIFSIDDTGKKLTITGNRQKVNETINKIRSNYGEYVTQIHQKGETVPDLLQQLFCKMDKAIHAAKEEYKYINNFFNPSEDYNSLPDLADILIINGVLHTEINNTSGKNEKNRIWPQKILQDLIFGNVSANNDALTLIKSDLESLEIPISAWLIDHREHLYNWHGKETFEPVFNESYLCDVALRMWELSTQIFGVSYFTYENLASIMREPDIQKVKLAVRRISIITSSNIEGSGENVIMSGDTNWKWMVDNNKKYCSCLNIQKVIKIINEAGERNE